MLHGKQEADRSFLFITCPLRREHGREPYFLRAPNQKLPTRTLPLPTRTTSMPQPRKQQRHLKNVAQEKKAKTSRRQVFKALAGSALVVRIAIRATPAAVDLMCKLLRLVAGRSVLLWVGCGCGEEILAILREVGRGVYVVALEKNEHDLGTFRSTLVAAEGVHPVDAKTDVFRLQSNGAKVRLVCVDADSLSNEQFAARAPAPLRITHIFSFAIGPLGAGRFTRAWLTQNR
jgi:SAM-dependent methyltransferase